VRTRWQQRRAARVGGLERAGVDRVDALGQQLRDHPDVEQDQREDAGSGPIEKAATNTRAYSTSGMERTTDMIGGRCRS
jgi:hypothetical protein